MRFHTTAGIFLLLSLALGAQPTLAAPKCEIDRPVVFAGLDWDSVRVHNNIARYIAREGYGCRTEAIPGSTIPLLAGMARGDIDVTMEIWIANVEEAYNKELENGTVLDLGVNFPDAVQGFYVPTYVMEGDPDRGIEAMAPELTSVFDLPRYKDLFRDPEEPDKGRIYNCILGWGCEKVNTKKIEVYGLDDDYTNFRPGTGAALAAAFASAYQRGKPIVGYYWGPTWILGKYDMTMLDEPPYDPQVWKELEGTENPDQACAWPVIAVHVSANAEFAKAAPRLVEFLKNYETSNKLVSQALAFMQDNDATAEEAAVWFLKEKESLWTKWVPGDVAEHVKASLM
ncbi:MAG: ABC transporter substrate-binding protein [Gammaproteobacteria bacterium]|nr:ABC transporter substrate-binding protein [Gammaproteobacteria bacterium]NIR82631.1 ABC transporter substrate-binding protein [Gammaproteobacteria bacterium]NIR89094.1 ABC transporter substrate-binding protein [Gammaproteobacteria bacterium]NIU03790.1 ABC transporter substrate-binding protein [Gammaproteobacteria bacterium]NIV51127.1 ABC transporter substrate-binding protein [Gammaproteobacteria bacterium]